MEHAGTDAPHEETVEKHVGRDWASMVFRGLFIAFLLAFAIASIVPLFMGGSPGP